jgi:hypothetical protein
MMKSLCHFSTIFAIIVSLYNYKSIDDISVKIVGTLHISCWLSCCVILFQQASKIRFKRKFCHAILSSKSILPLSYR